MRNSSPGNGLRLKPLVAGVLVALCGSVQAQETARSAQARPAEMETIVVTGTRIQRAGFETLEPATVVDASYIEERAFTNVADALNRIPGFGVGVTPEGAQASFGVGVNFVNRFGLGTNRTLTVVNGRRFVSSNPPTLFGPAAPGVQVDLNVIPTSIVERVENLAIGGAPTYGSDAIAGVVNVILKKDYEGLEVGGNVGITDRSDNERYNVYGLWGANFGPDDRGNVTLNLSYDRVEGLLQKERSFFNQGRINTTNPSASLMAALFPGRTPANDGRWDPTVPFNTGTGDGIPNAVLAINRRIWTTPFAGFLFGPGFFVPGTGNLVPRGLGPSGNVYLQFDSNGNLVPYDLGSRFSVVDASGGDGLNLTEAGQITADLERKTAYLTSRYGITDNVDVFFEGTYYQAESTELSDQWMYNSPLFGGLSGALQIPATHPMLTAQARQTLANLGATSFFLSRASRDLVTNNASGETTTWRAVLGLEGEFELGSRKFDWEVYANTGETEADYFGTSLIQQNFVNAMNVTLNAQGQPVCAGAPIPGLGIPGGNNPVPDPNCVPLDIFGDGRPTQAMRDYVTTRTVSNATIEQQVYNINVSSSLFDLWAGPILYNIGYERRKEEGAFDPGPFLEAGRGRAVPITPLSGSFETDEYFGEVVIPLVDPDSDWPLLKKFELIGKYRNVDNEINGSADTYTYGALWKPFDDLELRGNFTQAIRAPAITELFLPQATSFQFVTGDPCDDRFRTSGPNPAVRQQNCAAFLQYYGLTSFTSIAAGASIQGISGGNPNLENEESEAETLGFTWSPSFIDGFSLAADWYRIEIDNVITSLTAAQLAQACFDSTSFNVNDVPNANNFCSAITRNPPGDPTLAGQAITFVSGFVNGRYYNMEAYSAQATYLLDTDNLGRFVFSYTGYFPQELTINTTGINPDPARGEIGTSSEQHQLNVGWSQGALELNAQVNYLSEAVFDLLANEEARDIPGVGDYYLVNAGGSYQLSEGLRLRLTVTNLFDEKPPFPTTGIGVYDILGRRYNVSFDWKL